MPFGLGFGLFRTYKVPSALSPGPRQGAMAGFHGLGFRV